MMATVCCGRHAKVVQIEALAWAPPVLHWPATRTPRPICPRLGTRSDPPPSIPAGPPTHGKELPDARPTRHAPAAWTSHVNAGHDGGCMAVECSRILRGHGHLLRVLLRA
jgi:hypothetical protein